MLISSLGLGGMERSLTTLLRPFDRRRYAVQVAAFSAGPLLEELPFDVAFRNLGTAPRFNLPVLTLRFKRLLARERPDVVVAWGNYCNWVASMAQPLFGRRPRLILSEHLHPSSYLAGLPNGARRRAERLLYRSYGRADAVVAVSSGVAEDLAANLSVPPSRLKVLANPIDIDQIRDMARESVEHPWFDEDLPVVLYVGRFSREKNQALLLRAFADLRRRRPARLVLIGAGPLRGELDTLAAELGIAGHVAFLGPQHNPYKFMARASLLALSSVYEGFSLVLREAMALGCPVVSTRCPSGPEEAIDHGENGLLVPVGDPRAMAGAMLRVLEDDALRSRLVSGGLERVQEWSPERVARTWEELYSV